ncbi:MAG: hypothetical protein Q8M22_17400, partial [Actinomycetota bacterium]|nr:hypothetical protein [Actinomycetota bacterium]
PMLPAAGGDIDGIIDCPTEQVSDIAWADLDGDGWIEQLVAQIGDGDGATSPFTITTCGTALQVEPFEITGDGLAIYSVSLDTEYLLIGFLEGAPNGGVYVFDGQAIVPLQGFDGPARWAFASPIMSDPAETFGCLATDRGLVLVNRFYRLVGGNDVSNSTSMELTTVEVLTGVSTSTTFDLPEQQAEAGAALTGDCNGVGIKTL